MSAIADEIKSRVSVPDVIEMYVGVTPRHNRIPCPIHHGKNYNFSYDENRWHCFACGARGDCVSFVMQLFDLDYNQAIYKINTDFALELPTGRQLTRREKLAMQKAAAVRIAAARERERAIETARNAYETAMDNFIAAEIISRTKRPKTPDDVPGAEWLEAIGNIAYLKYLVDCADDEQRRIEADGRRQCQGGVG